MEQKFLDAVSHDHATEIISLLRAHPRFNINRVHKSGGTALHLAASNHSLNSIQVLLAHPALDPNVRNKEGLTAFADVCRRGKTAVVRLLLKDPRVDITLPDTSGRTPLWHASSWGRYIVVMVLIASGRDLGLALKGRDYDGTECTAAEVARNFGYITGSLLEKFMADPRETRQEICLRLGVLKDLAAELYALTVFMCDGLLRIKPAPTSTDPAASAATRFFTITSKLPMELQMILCNCAVGLSKQSVRNEDSEAAFRSLARAFLIPQPGSDLELDTAPPSKGGCCIS